MRIVRGLVGLLGELLITAGAFLLLFVGWQLVWTDVVADADADQVISTLQTEFGEPTSDGTLLQPRTVLVDPPAVGVRGSST